MSQHIIGQIAFVDRSVWNVLNLTSQIVPNLSSWVLTDLRLSLRAQFLGPVLFSVYMLALGQIIRNDLELSLFNSDDTQIYISSQPDLNSSSSNLSDCLLEIKAWM